MDKLSDRVVYLVRHGQSHGNVTPVYQPPDTTLTEQGIRQARTVAERLRHVPFDVLISSPLPRALQTAGYISKVCDRPVVESELFVERTKPTSIDGVSYDDPVAAAVFHDWRDSLFTIGKRVADGENYDDLVARADAALDFLTARPEPAITAVTHGFFLTVLVSRVLAGPALTPDLLRYQHSRMMVANTSVTAIRRLYDHHDGQTTWRLWTFNDHSHFAE